MTADGNLSLRIGAAALVALVFLQIVWHAWLFPPHATQLPPMLVITVLLPAYALWVCANNLRRGVLIGGIVSLFYFCHGVSSAWGEPASRALALAEIALTLAVIGALGWDARGYRRQR